MTTFFLIRHGKASPRGDDYDVLSEIGVKQSELLGAYFGRAARGFDAVYLGPLRRHIDTYTAMRRVALDHGLTMPEPILLRELDEAPLLELMRSSLAGRLATDSKLQELVQAMARADQSRDERLKPILAHMLGLWMQGEIGGDQIESYAAFAQRMRGALARLVSAEGYGRRVAVVSSVGAISVLLEHALGPGSPSGLRNVEAFPNASVTELAADADGFRLIQLGGVAHLLDEQLVTLI